MKRTRLRPKSKDTARVDRQIAKARAKYAQAHGCTQVHEIIGGNSRHRTKQDPRFWLPVKDSIQHDEIQYWSKAKQCAYKLVVDPVNFDLDAINDEYRCGGKDWPITWEQIGEELRQAIERGGF